MNKKIWFIGGLLTFCVSIVSCSSEFEIKETEVPKEVVSALKAKYPNANVTKWEAEREDGKFYFEAKWKENGKEKEVHISPDGSFVTEED
ncbi:MAG: hypothetical protein J0H92_00545 [Sphingobacteriales bacterium]|nr:hypothetical protein [Sphingobacteriales bacterium]OJW35479.1 MAG: hypothetical protein BGO54_04000 [Sphingobacteriales bacterium 46-32]